MSDTWENIKALKSKRISLREKLEKRKKERHGIFSTGLMAPNAACPTLPAEETALVGNSEIETDAEVEKAVLQSLTSNSLILPIISTQLIEKLSTYLTKLPTKEMINYILSKLSAQRAICVKNVTIGNEVGCEIISVEAGLLRDLYNDSICDSFDIKDSLKRRFEDEEDKGNTAGEDGDKSKVMKTENGSHANSSGKALTVSDASDDIMSLLSMPSTREKQSKQVGEEILELLTKPTAKERSVAEKFKSHGGAQVMEFCPHGTKIECLKAQQATAEMTISKRNKAKLNERNNQKKNEAENVSANVDERIGERNRAEANEGSGVADNVSNNDTKQSVKDQDQGSTLDNNKITNESETKPCPMDSGAEDGEILNESLNANKEATEPQTQNSDAVVTTGGVDDAPITVDKCTKLHFKRIIQSHTDETLGDCSFLNTCFHMATCKYVHYEVDTIPNINTNKPADVKTKLCIKRSVDPNVMLYPPQWIQCDLRFLDMTVLGKFAVVMADPPWDIHMELPYGTMSDDEMRQLGVPALQDDGLIFLWVTGRAMELGRECLKLWGYERVDELIWVKTNQLQRIIRTGRTGHWLNHGKEHCLVGMKGNPKNLNRGLDCDVIVAEVRATSHKPDEIYGIIERLSPGTRKIELFGRPHNVQPNWITLGNQLDGIRLVDPELITQFQKRYPDGNCMAPASTPVVPAPTMTK